MDAIAEVRAQLVRQQADMLALNQQLKATTPGTKEYGEHQRQVQQQELNIKANGQRLKSLLAGSQSSLL